MELTPFVLDMLESGDGKGVQNPDSRIMGFPNWCRTSHGSNRKGSKGRVIFGKKAPDQFQEPCLLGNPGALPGVIKLAPDRIE
jgi:hypothetical protein